MQISAHATPCCQLTLCDAIAVRCQLRIASLPMHRSVSSSAPNRFTADMGTDFLTRIGETGSAALACLLR